MKLRRQKSVCSASRRVCRGVAHRQAQLKCAWACSETIPRLILKCRLTLKSNGPRLRQGQQLLAESHAGAKNTRLYRGNGNSERLGQLTIGPTFRLLQNKRVLQRGIQAAK